MDRRRHRPFLNLLLLLGGGVAVLLLATNLSAQNPTPVPSASATPWVQASPPPGTAAATPKPSPSAAVLEDLKATMKDRRAMEEQRALIQDTAAQQGARDGKKEAARLEKLPADERAAYQRNLPIWRQLPEEEREDLRRQANERARQETDRAFQESGLTLDPDQREVFDLRYKQERRKVERELQEKAGAERARRLKEVSERLKREFATKPAASQGGDVPAPKKAPPTPPNPDATATPGFMR